MSGNDRAPKIQRLDELRHVARHIGRRVSIRRPFGIAVAPLCQRESVNRGGKVWQHELERMPGIGVSMKKHHGNSIWLTLFGVLELESVAELDSTDCDSRLSNEW